MAGFARFMVIKPGKFYSDAFRSEISAHLTLIQKDLEDYFNDTTQSWHHKVRFDRTQNLTSRTSMWVQVTTDDDIYRFVNDGTRRRKIFPNTRPYLSYRRDFTPKTMRGFVGSQAGGKTGAYVVRNWVDNPGIHSREFDFYIAKAIAPKLVNAIAIAMRNARSLSGHAI